MIWLLSEEGREALPVCFEDLDVEYAWPMETEIVIVASWGW